MKTLKKGQVTIFVIIGTLIVAGIIGITYFMGGFEVAPSVEENPRQFIIDCVGVAIENSLVVLMENGGQITMDQTTIYLGEEYNYLCYQGDFFSPCYNIHPMLEFLIEDELTGDTRDEVQNCFDTLSSDLQDKGYKFSGDTIEYSVDLLPGAVKINLNNKITLSRGETSKDFEDFDSEILSPLYELIKVSKDVVNSESRFCHFENNGYMILYPNYDIKKIDYDNNKIYRVIDRKSGIGFKFAVRSCAIPSGIGGDE